MFVAVIFGASVVCAVFPALLFCVNLRRFQAPDRTLRKSNFGVSVLIPARNEEANIGAAVHAVLANQGVELEVLVLDDDSSDRTGEIVREIASYDHRVRLVCGRELPPGWNGKQHACWVLAKEASLPLLVFLDADVRVDPELLARTAAFRERTGAALVSGFPRLITITWLEQLLLPLIHFVLLGFLPMGAMRRTRLPGFAAGCGQFMLVEREAYFASGGHSAIRETMHDGLLLPRVLRRADYGTDIADITALASVRMYDSAEKVWSGLAKNATEGIATVGKIVPLTFMLLLGQVVPALAAAFVLLTLGLAALLHFVPSHVALFSGQHLPGALVLLAVAAHGAVVLGITDPTRLSTFVTLAFVTLGCVYLPRLLAVRRFRQPLASAVFHPLGILVLLAVQWYALGRKLFGRPVGWRQRSYSSGTGAEVGS